VSEAVIEDLAAACPRLQPYPCSHAPAEPQIALQVGSRCARLLVGAGWIVCKQLGRQRAKLTPEIQGEARCPNRKAAEEHSPLIGIRAKQKGYIVLEALKENIKRFARQDVAIKNEVIAGSLFLQQSICGDVAQVLHSLGAQQRRPPFQAASDRRCGTGLRDERALLFLSRNSGEKQ